MASVLQPNWSPRIGMLLMRIRVTASNNSIRKATTWESAGEVRLLWRGAAARIPAR